MLTLRTVQEFLEGQDGRTVAAFGYHAGYAGAALAVRTGRFSLMVEACQCQETTPSQNEDELVEEVKAELANGVAKNEDKPPRVLVVGAWGRCEKGALIFVKLLEFRMIICSNGISHTPRKAALSRRSETQM